MKNVLFLTFIAYCDIACRATTVSCVDTNPPLEFLFPAIHLMALRASGTRSCRVRDRVAYAVASTERAELNPTLHQS